MPFCPKCEEEYRAGATECADCGVALVESLALPESLEDVEERFAEELFTDPSTQVVLCPTCLNEYAPAARVCSRCGGVHLVRIGAEECTKLLTSSPLHRMTRGEALRDHANLVRVHQVSTPAEAGFVVEGLVGMGVSAEIGDDTLDDMPDTSLLGIYVPGSEKDHAHMLLSGTGEHGESDIESTGSPYEHLVRNAVAYRDLQKYRHSIKLCAEAIEMDPHEPAAFLVLGMALVCRGDIPGARRAYETALEVQGPDVALFHAGACGLVDEEGQPCWKGSLADRSLDRLQDFVARQPRDISAWLVLLEARWHRGEQDAGREVCAKIRGVNHCILDIPGTFSEIVNQLEE